MVFYNSADQQNYFGISNLFSYTFVICYTLALDVADYSANMGNNFTAILLMLYFQNIVANG